MATSGDRKPQFWCAEVTWLVTVRRPSHSNKNKPHRVGTSPAESRETPTTTTALPLAFVSPRTPKNTQNICPSSAESFRLPYLRSPVPQQNCWRMIQGRQRGAPQKAASPRTSLWSTKFLQDDPPLPALAQEHPRSQDNRSWIAAPRSQHLRLVPVCTAAPRGVSKPSASPRRRQPLGEASQLHHRHGKPSGISSAPCRDGELVGSTL